MLSKLKFFRSHDSTELVKLRALVQPDFWADQLGALPYHFRQMPGGTLNLAFEGLTIDGERRCFKTHVTECGRLALRRESTILQALYGDRLDVCNVTAGTRDWLVMHLLDPIEPTQCRTLDPEWISSVIDVVAGIEGQTDKLDRFEDVVKASQTALTYLVAASEVKETTALRLRSSIDRLAESTDTLGQQLCHGDLGPQNIMQDSKGFVLLDWEDMLLAVPGYDWIYWLSFFANRHLLSRDALLRCGLPEQLCRDMIVSIILVKSELSQRSGAAVAHKMTIEDRLRTTLDLS